MVLLNRKELEKIHSLLETAYQQIDKGLDSRTFASIEWNVAKGLDTLLEAKHSIEEKIERD